MAPGRTDPSVLKTAPAILPADPSDPRVQALIDRHLDLMRSVTPPESLFALDAAGLIRGGARLFAATTAEGELVGIGAFRQIGPEHVEVKSMHVAAEARGCGAGRALLNHILAEARNDGAARASLETGRALAFAPAIALYRSAGFTECAPFVGYEANPFSIFLTREL